MKMDNLQTASEMKAIAVSKYDCSDKILRAAEDGKFSIQVSSSQLPEDVKKTLKEKGYMLIIDGWSTHISWK